jgi:hypothetical protein
VARPDREHGGVVRGPRHRRGRLARRPAAPFWRTSRRRDAAPGAAEPAREDRHIVAFGRAMQASRQSDRRDVRGEQLRSQGEGPAGLADRVRRWAIRRPRRGVSWQSALVIGWSTQLPAVFPDERARGRRPVHPAATVAGTGSRATSDRFAGGVVVETPATMERTLEPKRRSWEAERSCADIDGTTTTGPRCAGWAYRSSASASSTLGGVRGKTDSCQCLSGACLLAVGSSTAGPSR